MKQTKDNLNIQDAIKSVLLIRPNVHVDIADFSGFSFAEPLDLGYLAAYAKAEGYDSDIVDMIVDKNGRNITKLLKRKKYDMVAFTGHVTAAVAINELAAKVKKFDKSIVTVVCGIMAAVNPFMYDTIVLDAIIKTDPYETFTQILDKMQVGETDYVSLNGVYHKDKPETEIVKYTPKYFPLREKLADYAHAYRHSYLGTCVSIKTSFGCPNSCNFCLYAKGGYGKYWERDLEDVFAELIHIKEPNIMILDDNFTANIKRLEAFIDGLEKYNIKKTFFMLATTKAVANNPDIIKRFTDNGLKYVFLGVESFRDEELEALNKRTTAQNNHDALKVLKDLDIEVNAGIICQPHYKQEDFDFLIENLSKYVPIFPMINVLTPMPGTAMHEKHKGSTAVSKKKYKIFNMMEHVIKPTNMSKGKFYANILRVYKATTGSREVTNYIVEKYGKNELKRHTKVSQKVLLNIIKLMFKR